MALTRTAMSDAPKTGLVTERLWEGSAVDTAVMQISASDSRTLYVQTLVLGGDTLTLEFSPLEDKSVWVAVKSITATGAFNIPEVGIWARVSRGASTATGTIYFTKERRV